MATNLTGFYLVFSGFFLMYFHFVLPAQVLRSPADLARRAEAIETGKKKKEKIAISYFVSIVPCRFGFLFWFFFAVLPSLMKKKRRVATSLANVINCVNRFQTSFVFFI